jgi:4-amino-4-deoxy-L-arabinose transferase-like glycosyltransferase
MAQAGASTNVGHQMLPVLPKPSRFINERSFFLFLSIYLAVQCVARSLLSEAAGIDEAWQVMVGQKLSWGYGPHAPLYTWLMILFFKVFGSSTLALNLLRESLLFGIYAFTYLNTRQLTGNQTLGVLAAALLQFHPTIVWESQRELTNSLAASFTILAALYFFIRAQSGQWRDWIAFGVCGGLATLSKYNAAVIFAALLLAAATLGAFRGTMPVSRLLPALCFTGVLIAPNLWWVHTHKNLAFQLVWKFGIHESMDWPTAAATGLKHWFESAAAHIAPIIAVFCLLSWNSDVVKSLWAEKSDGARLLRRELLIIFCIAIASVLLVKVTEFKDRWLQPLFIILPVFVIVTASRTLSQNHIKRVLWLSLTVSIVVGFAASGRLLFTENRGRRDVLNAPFGAISRDLAPMAANCDFMVSGDYWLAGNLRLRFPSKRAYSPDLLPAGFAAGNRCLVTWEVGRKDEPPPDLVRFAQEFTGDRDLPTPGYVEELWKYHHSRMLRIGYWVLERSARNL